MLSDNRAGARRAVEHLIAHGHRRIAYVGPAPNGLFTAAERFEGYRAALAAAGIGEEIVCFDGPRGRCSTATRRRPRSSARRTW